ncbi:hypothetical protein [Haliangium ochraceum]|uniref:Uncharacterized protein n=1 Tax=Haliangium ochraceum (strain DSM 14365 / JCM 11303 / SMP-2) TaxID=502025 RepID=D0LGM6_HALO1|nr:hypothetical protein [Haliangium ochraceum]ACY12772.1 hypothetical protein Hoch_0131 [Haliangium ochraceum DSM 14365]
MNLDKSGRLFFGCKIDSKLRDAMEQATPSKKRYFEGTEFLTICTAGEERWIGKIVDGGMTASTTEDIQRNVVSILRNITTNVRISPSSVKVFVVAAERELEPQEPLERESRGPYIANY